MKILAIKKMAPFIAIIFILAITTFIQLNKSSFLILSDNKRVIVLIIPSLLIVSFVLYKKTINIGEIERRLKRYREKRGVKYEIKKYEEEDVPSPLPRGSYSYTEKKIEIEETFPHPNSARMRLLQEVYPAKFKEIREILLSIIKNPEMNKKEEEELRSKFYRLKEDLYSKLRGEELKELRQEIDYIQKFINSPPEDRKLRIARYIIGAAHEHGHAILDDLLYRSGISKIPYAYKEFHSPAELASLHEGFADAFSLYFMLKEVEKENCSFEIAKLAARCLKEARSEFVFKYRSDKRKIVEAIGTIPYVIGGRIFGVEEAIEKIRRIDQEKMSETEMREKIREIREELGRKMNYIKEIIADNSLSVDEKLEKLEEIERKARFEFFREYYSER